MPKVLIFESDTVFAEELRSGLERHACSVTVVAFMVQSSGSQAPAEEQKAAISPRGSTTGREAAAVRFLAFFGATWCRGMTDAVVSSAI